MVRMTDDATNDKTADARPEGAEAARPGAEHPSVADLIAAFHDLRQADRIAFVRRVARTVPDEVWLDMLRGGSADRPTVRHADVASKAERVRIRTELWLEANRALAERLDFPDAPILMTVSSKAEKVRLRACAKEPWTVDWIRDTVHEGDVLYDIGANVGPYSLIAAMKPGAAARVVAFEAGYANIAALCTNIILNGVAERIIPLPVALSDENGLARFNLLEMAPGAARHTLGNGASREGPTFYPQPVLTFRLDDLVDQAALPAPNHIKLDVDGGELAVLRGAARTLAAPSVRSLLIEVSTELSDAVTRVIEGHGLTLRSKVNVRSKSGEYKVWYGVFMRSPSV
jgi:FkbM family methyltransferase